MSKCNNPACNSPTQVFGCKYCPQCYPAFSRLDDLERHNTDLREKILELNCAKELLFWWADRLSNCKDSEIHQVVREGYSRIVTLARVLNDGSAVVKEPAND